MTSAAARVRVAKAMKALADRRKKAGACVRCGVPALLGKTLCEAHAAFDAARAKRRRKERLAAGLCLRCPDRVLPGRQHCPLHDAAEVARLRQRTEKRFASRTAPQGQQTAARLPPRPPNPPPNRTPDAERERIRVAFVANAGNGEATARRLGINRCLVNKLARDLGWREGLPPRVPITEPKRYPVFGELLTLSEMAEASGESRNAIKIRIRRGRTAEEAFRRPVRRRSA